MQRIRRRLRNHSSRKLTLLFALWWLGAEFSIALAAGPAQAESEAEAPAPTWFAQTMAAGERGIKVVNFWSSGAKFRSESVMGGHPVVTIVSGDTYYAYDALRMEGIAIRRSKAAIAADSPDHRPFGNEFETLRRQGAEKVREEKIIEIPCDVYQLSNKAGRRIVWVSQKSGLPLRLEIYDRQSGVTKYKEFFNWRTNLSIHDEFFRPDPAVQLKRINLDEYLTAMSSEDSAISIPILFGELLKGPDS